MSGAFECENFVLGSKYVYTDWIGRLTETILPVFDMEKDQRYEFCSLELPATWINPDDRLILFCAQENHVVVRGHNHLIRPFCVYENDLVG